jgi:hypothetical protein
MIPLSLQTSFFSFEFTLTKRKTGKSQKTSNNSNPLLEVRNIRKQSTFLASKVLAERHANGDWKHSSTVLNLGSRWRGTLGYIPPLLFRQGNEAPASFEHEAAWATDRRKGIPCPCRAVSKQKRRTCIGPLLYERKLDISQACC